MLAVLRISLPLAAAAYFVVKARRSSIYLLGIPFLMFMRWSVFFESLGIFWMPGRLSANVHILMWLALVWVLCSGVLLAQARRSKRRGLLGPPLQAPEELLLIILAAYLACEVLVSAIRYGSFSSVASEAAGVVSMFVGYVLIRGIASWATRGEVTRFLSALIVVNTVAAALFIVHQGFNIQIYPSGPNSVTIYMGQAITRSFTFMPQLFTLALAFAFARRRWTRAWVAVVLITFVALWVSYTRSLIVIGVAELVVVLAVRAVKKEQSFAAYRRLIAVGLAVLVVAAGVRILFPAQTSFFASRFGEAFASRTVTSEGNLSTRLSFFDRASARAASVDPLFGAGFPSPSQDALAGQIPEWTADTVWAGVVYHFGAGGLGLFVALFVMYGWRALKMAMSRDEGTEFMGLVWLCVTVGTFIEGFVSSTFLTDWRYVMGLWFVAFLAGEASRPALSTQQARSARLQDWEAEAAVGLGRGV